jgi:hypothetical protein
MKSKIKEYKFHEPLYFVDISVLIGGDVPQLITFIKERHGDAQMYSFGEKFNWAEDADTTDAYQFNIPAPLGKGEIFYLWVYDKTPYLFGHELFHLTGDILYHRGIKYSMESEEAFAYYFGYIFQEIFKLLKGKL